MYNNNDARVPLLVNAVFAGNTAPTGQDIAMSLDSAAGENIRIAGVGFANATNGVVGVGSTGTLNLTYHSLANGEVNFGDNMTTGGGVPTRLFKAVPVRWTSGFMCVGAALIIILVRTMLLGTRILPLRAGLVLRFLYRGVRRI